MPAEGAWEYIGITQEGVESVAVESDMWNTMLKLLPPRTDPGKEGNGWLDSVFLLTLL